MKGKGEKQELKHAVIGMDRLENIYKKLGLYESIVIIINSTIMNNINTFGGPSLILVRGLP